MIVVAHPDDEVIALGARLPRFRDAHLVHTTDGAPRNEQDSRAAGFSGWEQYRDARQAELQQALCEAGLPSLSRECLGFADQSSSFHLCKLTRVLSQRIAQHRPEVIITHPFEGGHPDHDACAFAVHHAVAAAQKRNLPAPLIVEAAFYHAGPEGIVTGEFLPGDSTAHCEYLLTAEEQERKQRELACFTTQQQTLGSFRTLTECFRIAPAYDFTRPHAGAVLYDNFPWGITSPRFRELAEEAERWCSCREIDAWV